MKNRPPPLSGPRTLGLAAGLAVALGAGAPAQAGLTRPATTPVVPTLAGGSGLQGLFLLTPRLSQPGQPIVLPSFRLLQPAVAISEPGGGLIAPAPVLISWRLPERDGPALAALQWEGGAAGPASTGIELPAVGQGRAVAVQADPAVFFRLWGAAVERVLRHGDGELRVSNGTRSQTRHYILTRVEEGVERRLVVREIEVQSRHPRIPDYFSRAIIFETRGGGRSQAWEADERGLLQRGDPEAYGAEVAWWSARLAAR